MELQGTKEGTEGALPAKPPTYLCDSLELMTGRPTPLATDPLLGRTIDRYLVLERIGEGGMGAVYAVEHVMLRKRMAMKLLRPELLGQDELLGRFHQEAIAAGRIGQENIVSVTDFGRTEDGLAYLVMEELRGRSLAQAIAQARRLRPARAVAIATQIARALEAAHAAGIVHRDLKPDNVMLLPREEGELVKILDFGVSKMSFDDDQRRTQVGMILGTPDYMSPEQAAGRPVDHRSDVYSFGVVLFEMLAGRTPFVAENPVRLLLKHQSEPPPPLESVAPTAAAVPGLAALVAACLEKRPEERPQSMSSCLARLRALALELAPAPGAPDAGSSSPASSPTVVVALDAAPTLLTPSPAPPARPSLSPMLLGRYRLTSLGLREASLSPEEAFVASRLSGCELSASDLLAASGLPRERTLELLRALMGKGVVERRPGTPRPEAPPATGREPAQRAAPAQRRPSEPAGPDSPLGRAAALRQLGRGSEALRELRAALAQDPNGPSSAALRAALERLEGELALEAYEDGLRADARRDWEAAEEAFARALALTPRNPRYLERVARKLLYRRGDPAEARRLAELAKRLWPDDVDVRITLGNAYSSSGLEDLALRELDVAAALPGAPLREVPSAQAPVGDLARPLPRRIGDGEGLPSGERAC